MRETQGRKRVQSENQGEEEMRVKRYLQVLIVAAMCVVIDVQLGFGAGFALYEGSARGLALGGTLVGRADDPSALFYNPAGITQLPGLEAMVGDTLIFPGTHVIAGGQNTSTKSVTFYPPHGYLSYGLTDKVWVGFGMFSQFGLGTEYPENWPGRYNVYKAFIQSLTFNPNIAFKLNDKISMAVGLDIIWFDLDLRQALNLGVLGLGTTNQILKGDSVGYGFNAALHYKACDWLALGVSYRSRATENVDGRASFSPNLRGVTSTSASGMVTLPDEVFLGAAFYPTKRLSIEVGATWTNWSTFKDVTISYDDPPIFTLRSGGSATSIKNWSDVWRFQLGVEYKALDWLDLRAGYIYDIEPIPDVHADYMVPANDRHIFSFGPGFHFGNWAVDLTYAYLLIEDRTVIPTSEQAAGGVLPSKFEDGHAHLVGMSLGYKF